MRRNSTYQNPVGLFFFFMALFAGLVLSSLYPFIPSLAGFLFCYTLIAFKDEEQKIPLMFSFAYLVFYDLHKGFYLFSYAILFILFYPLATQKIRYITSCKNCILALYVTVGYFGHYLLNLVLAYFFNAPFPYFSNHYFYYVGIDALVAFMFLRLEK